MFSTAFFTGLDFSGAILLAGAEGGERGSWRVGCNSGVDQLCEA
ncbi:hypothetical protein, partial, partial [Parasitella parasitica]